MSPEAAARQTIDKHLVAAGWAIQDYKAFYPGAARGIALRKVSLDFGRCDYLLLVVSIPLGVVEAEKKGTTLATVSDQSAHHGENLSDFLANLLPGMKKIPFAYESTGVETLFRDERDPEPRSRRVFAFRKPKTLATWLGEPESLRASLAALLSAHPLRTTYLRTCQVEAITSKDSSPQTAPARSFRWPPAPARPTPPAPSLANLQRATRLRQAVLHRSFSNAAS